MTEPTIDELKKDYAHALSIIDELQANEKDSIMALEVCGEKIDTYIDRRKEDEKRIAELEAENARLKEIAEYTRKIRVTVHDPDDWIVLGRLLDEDARARR